MELARLIPMDSCASVPKSTKVFAPMLPCPPRYGLALILLLLGSSLAWAEVAQADVPAGTIIENRATGSFDDPFAPADTSVSVESNLVTVTVAEVAGITATGSGLPQEAPSGVAGAGSWQGNGSLNTDDVVYFDFLVTNTGNDPTQFWIPGQVNISGGTLQGNVQILQVDPDGSGAIAPLASPTTASPINVPATGATTATLLATAANPSGLPAGSLAIGGTVKIRVPVKITAAPGTGAVTVTLGDTGSNDNSASTQNQPYSASSPANRDLYTQDNPDNFGVPEVAGSPINGDASGQRQEASASQSINVAAIVRGQVWEDANGSLAIDAIGGGVNESGTNASSNTNPAALTVYALDSNGLVVAKSLVATNGTYSLSLPTNASYRLRLVNNNSLAIGAGATSAETTALAPSLPSGYLNTGENFNNSTETVTPGEIAITGLAANLNDYNFGIQRSGYCTIGSGTNDSNVQRYISTEVGGNTPTTRSYVDTLDDDWRSAAGGTTASTATPWFGTSSAPGSINSFIFKEPGSNVPIPTTVTSLRLAFDATTPCSGSNTVSNTSTLAFPNNMQGGAPLPASMFNSSNQPGVWSNTNGSGSNRRNAVKFTFQQPVKSFGAWFGDLETSTRSGSTPAYLRLIDSNGNRIGQDIAVQPQTIYTSTNPSVQTLDQTNCGGTFTGCGNNSSRWIGFVDNVPIARVKEVIVIVGDDDSPGSGSQEGLSFTGANFTGNPNLLLVKRITRVNGSTTTSDGLNTLGYIDDPNNPYDDNTISNPAVTPADTSSWPTDGANQHPLLAGVTNGGQIKPNSEVEYTIYFLSTGNDVARGVVLCDRIPAKQTFLPYAFNLTGTTGIGRGIQVLLNGTVSTYTNGQDADAGSFYPPGSSLPPACGTAPNQSGAVVVQLGNLPAAQTNPTGAYGYVRFRVKVD
jgi:uncharacterized repeat protein (TIGR01451 family)